LERWSVKDPIPRYRQWLQGQGLVDEASLAAINREVETAVEATRNRLKSMEGQPAGEVIFGRVYQSPPDSFVEERNEFEASLENP
jgi:TPP-dependent pyruvate/acetoin dehydrogenase alpha subunit